MDVRGKCDICGKRRVLDGSNICHSCDMELEKFLADVTKLLTTYEARSGFQVSGIRILEDRIVDNGKATEVQGAQA